MKLLRHLAILLCLMTAHLVQAESSTTRLPAARDLRDEGATARTAGKPLVVLFTLPNCEFCRVVRQNYLLPMSQGSTAKDGPIVREVDISSSAPLLGFGGERITQQLFAWHMGVRVAPTVMMFDSSGTSITTPLVGGDTSGLYGGLLDSALARATQKLKSQMPPIGKQ